MAENMPPALAEGDPSGDYVTEWHCDPPPDGSVYRVLRDEWAMAPVSEGGAIRHVHAWALIPSGHERIAQSLIGEIARLTTEKGWRTADSGSREGHEFAAYVALGHSEFSEALEAYRDKVWSETCTPQDGIHHRHCSGRPHGPGKPVGVGPELADVIIRALDMADIWDIDINRELERVLAYGWMRSFRHGGRQL
jgi:hypothetical protein